MLGFTGIAAFHTSVYTALKTTTAVNAVLFLSLSPVLIVLGSSLSRKDTISRLQLLGILVSLTGAVVLVAHGDMNTLTRLQFFQGDLWMLFAVTMWSAYSILLKNKPRELPQLSLLIGSIVWALGMLGVMFIVFQGGVSTAVWSMQVFTGLLYVSIFASIVAFLFWNRGVAQIGPNKAGVFLHLMPVFGALLSVMLLKEGIAIYHLAGAALVFLGIAMSTRLAK